MIKQISENQVIVDKDFFDYILLYYLINREEASENDGRTSVTINRESRTKQ